jgi:Tol biopolymer transport system component
VEDVYVYDADTGSTTLAGVDRNGVRAGNGPSNLVQVSGNGRYVLFASSAGNLVDEPVATDVRNFYVRDLVTNTTKLVSVTKDGRGGRVADTSEYYLTGHQGWISNDGRYVTFIGLTDEYVTNDHNDSPDLFQRDTSLGTTSLVSLNLAQTAAGNQGGGMNPQHGDFAVTPNGRLVIFTSHSSDLVTGDANQKGDCFIRDTVAGMTHSLTGSLPRATGLSAVESVDISPDGRYASFLLVEQADGSTEIHSHRYLYDAVTGGLMDLSAPGGTYLGEIIGAGFSADSKLYFFGTDKGFLPLDTNNNYDVYAVQLGSQSKRRSPVALIAPLGQ